jgi:hypothetical protein
MLGSKRKPSSEFQADPAVTDISPFENQDSQQIEDSQQDGQQDGYQDGKSSTKKGKKDKSSKPSKTYASAVQSNLSVSARPFF